MKFQTMKKNFVRCSALMSLFLIFPVFGYSAESREEPAPVVSGAYEGEVIGVEEQTLVIKQTDGDIFGVRMPGKSGKKSTHFQIGDKLEVVVSPEGHTTSVQHRLVH